MNSQERDALNLFLQQLAQAPAPQKEPEADALIAKTITAQPDAGYLLVQRAMQLDYVLQQSQAKVAELQAELARAKAGNQTSFLGDAYAWGRGPAAPVAGPGSGVNPAAGGVRPATQMSAAPSQPATAAATTAPAAAAAPAPWGSSVMGTVATTAAGVVAGSFLFQGIQNLMGNHSPGGGFGNQASNTPAAPATVNETTVNNYYANDPSADQAYTGGGTSYADASDSFESDDFGSDDSDFA
jgi:hypothetical protein